MKSAPQGDFVEVSVLMEGWETKFQALVSQKRPIKYDMYLMPGIPQEFKSRLSQHTSGNFSQTYCGQARHFSKLERIADGGKVHAENFLARTKWPCKSGNYWVLSMVQRVAQQKRGQDPDRFRSPATILNQLRQYFLQYSRKAGQDINMFWCRIMHSKGRNV